MPDHARTTTDAVGARHPNVALVTPIFQSDDDAIDGGVCRGMASRWIGAQLLGDENVVNFRKLATNTDGKIDKEFVNFQAAFNAVAKEFTTTREKSAKLVAEALRLDGILNGTVKKGFFESTPTAASVQEATNAALKSSRDLTAAASLLQRYMSGGLQEVNKVADVAYATFEQALRTHLTGNGFYYISLGGTHAIAFYIAQAGKCLFIDANTGEWMAQDLLSLSAFFADYMHSLYDAQYAGRTVAIFFLAAVITVA